MDIPVQIRLLHDKVQHFEKLTEAEKKKFKSAREPDYADMSSYHMQANVWRAALVLIIESFGLKPDTVITHLREEK